MNILFAGGATGGHLFPGIAAAQALRDRGSRVMFLCSSKPFDARELTKAGLEFCPLPAVGLSLKKFHRTFAGGLTSLGVAFQVIQRFRPNLVVGLGGYPSAAPLAVARIARVPYVLMEQNTIPGKVTRLFASGARRIYLQWDYTRRYLGASSRRARTIGSPLRSGLRRIDRAEARAALGIPQNKLVVSVLGGSQGAHRLNLSVLEGLDAMDENIFVVHQTGPADRPAAEARYRERGIGARVIEFEPRMDLVYTASDLVICRAGALTLQELSFYQVPAVLVPLPTSADGHQKLNADVLHRSDCALVRDESALHAGFLREVVLSYRANHERFIQRGQRFASFFRHDGRELFANDVLGIAG
jgi:UDP-N-acetylglucosamine--N-acetylmuramyl-(pentapeptide) pyrophosphoryl-undecaprenol N-acetylglucosamine transferase